MSELTSDQKRVLQYIDYFEGGHPEAIRRDLRCAFAELEILGLIKKVTTYHLTDAGREAIPAVVGGSKE